MPEAQRDARSRAVWQALRARLPIMAAEVVSVVFAVLVALAVDEWWEDRENRELGRQSMAAVEAEIAGNRDELRSGAAQIDTMLARLDSILAAIDDGGTPYDVSITYPVALLSDAAWETAQVTRAVHYVPLESVIRVARVYDMQAFVARNQDALVEQISTMGMAGDDSEIPPMLRELRARYHGVALYREALMNSYACSLAELAGREPQSADDCEAIAAGLEDG